MRMQLRLLAASLIFVPGWISAPPTLQAQDLLGDLLEDRAVEVQVLAADKKGRAVTGLNRADLELLEDGQPLAIHEVGAGRGPLRLVLYFDHVHVLTAGRNRVIDGLLEAMAKGVGDDSEWMIAAYDGILDILLPFTNDLAAARSTLAELESQSPVGDELDTERQRLLEKIAHSQDGCGSRISEVQTHARDVYERVELSLANLETLIRSLSSVGGRKALVLISDGFDLFAGQELFDQLAAECDDDSLSDLAQELDSSRILIDLAATAGSSNTAIVAVEAFGPLSSGGPSTARRQPSGDSEPTGLVVKSADGVPMVPIAGLGDSGGGAPTVAQLRARNLRSSLAFLANQTGGYPVFDARAFKDEFASMSARLMPYYSLTFTPERSPDGRIHSLEVRATKKGVETRSSRTYRDQRAARDFGDRLLAFLLQDTSESNRLDIGVTVTGPDGANPSRHLAQIVVPLAAVVLRPMEGELKAKLAFLAAAKNQHGQVTRLQEMTVEISPLPGDSEHVQSMPIDLLEGDQVLAVAVVDVGGESASFAKQQVSVPGGSS